MNTEIYSFPCFHLYITCKSYIKKAVSAELYHMNKSLLILCLIDSIINSFITPSTHFCDNEIKGFV